MNRYNPTAIWIRYFLASGLE